MSFWSDASPVTKGAIVVGPVLILIAILVFTGVIGGGDAEVSRPRGLEPPAGAAQ